MMRHKKLFDQMDEELFYGFDNLKISAFTKYSGLNQEEFNEITLGPNSVCKEAQEYSFGEGLNNSENARSNFKLSSDSSQTEYRNVTPQNQAIREQDDGLPIREVIRDLENERIKSVNSAMQKRLDAFQKHTEILENEKRQKLWNQQQRLIQNMQQEEQKILEMLREVDANRSAEHEKLVKHYQDLAEQRKRNAAELEAREKQRMELVKNIESTKKIHVEFSNVYVEILNFVKSFYANNEFKVPLSEEFKLLKMLFSNMEEIVSKCKASKVTAADVEKANDILTKIKSLKTRIVAVITDAKNKIEAAKSTPIVQNKPNEMTQSSTQPVQQPVAKQTTKVDTSQVPQKLNRFISRENLKMYSEIMEFLDQYVQSYKELNDNPHLKQFRFDCKKAINIPVNAISAVSSQHLRDKYDRLYSLLMGHQVKITDNTYFSAAKHPQGIRFCTDLLARKMVLQADLMISSNPEAAFCYASIIVALWNTVPDFGKLFLGYLYKACPFLVPFNIPKSADQSDEEFYRSQGYQYEDGQIEKQDKYLKRMTGIMRLYAAILITTPKRNQKHPHGIANGWRWLASTLKLEPRMDITATMLHTFLEVAGYHMQLIYNRAFRKLLQIIIVKFVPVMKQTDSGGPVTRLEVLLQEYQEKRQFDKPSGMLPDDFW